MRQLLVNDEVRQTSIRKKIEPHYRAGGRRQVSGGVFGACMTLSAHYRDSLPTRVFVFSYMWGKSHEVKSATIWILYRDSCQQGF